MSDNTPKPNIETSSASGAPPPLPSPQSQTPRPKKSGGVPVGLGIVLGILMVIGGTCLNLFPDDGKDQAMEITLGKILLVCGAALVVGGIFVLVAEKKQRHPAEVVSPDKIITPKWAYVFAGACIILGILGGFIGALVGFGGAAMCVGFSRNQTLSVPRRIYACILTVGFSWMVAIAVASQLLSAMNSANH
jgi:hypothetical protein